MINTAVNPLTVIYRRKDYELLDDGESHARMHAILQATIGLLWVDTTFTQAMALAPDDSQLLQESFVFIEAYRGITPVPIMPFWQARE